MRIIIQPLFPNLKTEEGMRKTSLIYDTMYVECFFTLQSDRQLPCGPIHDLDLGGTFFL